ncbi:uncharacterized protein LOC142242539 [Haematobia irritans]|uniref:uncharacterized protein LOC142242539 n=1 Tax=Haematobia irritans TaxID=7368 RepID=UPI003F4FE1D5
MAVLKLEDLTTYLSRFELPVTRSTTRDEINISIENMSSAITEAIAGSTRKFRPTRGSLRNLPDDIKELIRKKKNLRRRRHRILDRDEANLLGAIIRNLGNIIAQRINKFEEDNFVETLEKIKPGTEMFRQLKKLGAGKRRAAIPTLKDTDDRNIVTDMDKANAIADIFANIQHGTVINDSEATTTAPDATLYSPTIEFNEIILADGTSDSPEQFRLVDSPEIGADPTIPSSYRPISLLPAISKLFEILILARLEEHIIENGTLSRSQFGFRRATSTTHALTTFMHKVINGINARSPTIAVSLDFKKAFDIVWQAGITK